MPRNSAGVYTLPATNPVVPFTTISASWANPTMSDIASELTNSLDRNGRGGMLAPFKIFDGTAGSPGMGFLNEPSLGIYRVGTGVMALVSGGQAIAQISNTALGILTKTVQYGTFTVRETGSKWWRVQDNAGSLEFTPSASINTEDWDATKTIKFNTDGTMTFTIGAGGLPYLPKAGGTVTGLLTASAGISVNTLTVTGAATVGTTLGVTGAVTFSSTLGVTGALTSGAATVNGLLSVKNSSGTAAFYGYKNDNVPGSSGVPITRFYGYAPTTSVGDKVAGGIEVVSAETWSDTANGGQVNIRAVQPTTTTLKTVFEASYAQNHSAADLIVTQTAAGSSGVGKIQFGNSATHYITFDGSGWTWAGTTTKTISGSVAVAVTTSSKKFNPTLYTANITGSTTVDYDNGMSQQLALTGNATVSFSNIPQGSMLRVIFTGLSSYTLTINGVTWPMAVTPSYSAGAQKKCLVSITYDGTLQLGNAAVY